MDITYSGGSIIKNCVVQVWDDRHSERAGFYRAYWCADAQASTGSPVIGYCSAGGSHHTIRAVVAEVRKLYPDAEFYRNGKRIN